MTILEDTTKQHQQTIQSLLDFVGAVGVPKERSVSILFYESEPPLHYYESKVMI
jgi:hypothetical protein